MGFVRADKIRGMQEKDELILKRMALNFKYFYDLQLLNIYNQIKEIKTHFLKFIPFQVTN